MQGFGEENLSNIEGGIQGFKFKGGTIGDILSTLMPIFFFIGGILLLIYLITGGISLMTAAGDPKKAAAARTQLTNAIIGIVIIITAFFIVQAFGLALGIKPIIQIF